MIVCMAFDEALRLARETGVSSANPCELSPHWHAWVEEELLHVVNTWTANRARRTWSFDINASQGSRLIFKFGSTQAYCYLRPGAQNPIEEAVLALEPGARIDVVLAIRIELLESTRGEADSWWSIATDGQPVNARQTNQKKLLMGERLLFVRGGTWAVQWMGTLPLRLVYTRAADQLRLPVVIRAENAIRWITMNPVWNEDLLRPFVELAVLLKRRVLLQTQEQAVLRLVGLFHQHLPHWLMASTAPAVTGLDDDPLSYPSDSVVQQLLAIGDR
jgi:hypothetical protein